MTQQRRATRIEVVQARTDRAIVRPFIEQLSAWQAQLARLDAQIGHLERRGADPSEQVAKLTEMRLSVAATLAEFDRTICGREISSTIGTTRQVFVRLLDLIDATIA